jgi:hypothetical protein
MGARLTRLARGHVVIIQSLHILYDWPRREDFISSEARVLPKNVSEPLC